MRRALKASSLYPHDENVYRFHFEDVDIPSTGILCHTQKATLTCTLRIESALLKVTPINLLVNVVNQGYVITYHGLNLT